MESSIPCMRHWNASRASIYIVRRSTRASAKMHWFWKAPWTISPRRKSPSPSRGKVLNALLHEPVFARYGIQVARNGTPDVVRETLNEDGWAICIAARSGVVQLSGKVDSLSHRRLAEVRAWWTGGCELVEKMLKVSPPERETDDELTAAVRLELEMDPLVHADQNYTRARDGVVTLEGYVTSIEEKKLAIMDTWYIPGVLEVADRLAARS